MYHFVRKIDKLWDKIQAIPSSALERAWNIAKKSPVRINGDYLKYLDNISIPKFGPKLASKSTFNSKFKNLYEEVADQIGQVHHAVPQSVIHRFPNLNISLDQMHSLENLRGIPVYGTLDHQTITNYWEAFFNANDNPSMQEIFEYVEFIDDEFGHLFIPPVR